MASLTFDARKLAQHHITMTIHIEHGKEMRARMWIAGLLCSVAARIGGFRLELEFV